MSKSTPVPASRHVPNIVVSGGSCRFKRLKLYARTLTKSGKEGSNAAVVESRGAGTTQETVKDKRGKLGAEPEFLPVLAPKGPNNFQTLIGENLEGQRHPPNHLSPPLLSEPAPGARDTRTLSGGEAHKQSNTKREGGASAQLDRFSAASQSSLVPLSNAFRDTVYLDAIPAWAPPQQSRKSPKSPEQPFESSSSPPMSPSFLNPRQAPQPPPVDSPTLTLLSEASIVTGGTGDSRAATIASTDSNQSAKYFTPIVDGRLPAFLNSPPIEGLAKSIPSSESGLERIGAALLAYYQSSDDDCLLTTSCSSLDAHRREDQSLGSLLDTMERHGSFFRGLSQSQSGESVATFILPSLNSAPANLADNSLSLNDFLSSNSRNFASSVRVKSLLHASFTETISNLEQLLQDQGVTVPSSRNLVELWQALSIGAGRDSFSASRTREVLPAAKCEPHTTSDLVPAPESPPSASPHIVLLEPVEDVLKLRPQLETSGSDMVKYGLSFVPTEPATSSGELLLSQEGDSIGLNGIGIAI